MASKIADLWQGYIVGLLDADNSLSIIVKGAKKRASPLASHVVGHITQLHKNGFPPEAQNAQALKRKQAQPSRTPAVVAHIKKAVTQENPPTQRSLAKRTGISKGIVCRIIH